MVPWMIILILSVVAGLIVWVVMMAIKANRKRIAALEAIAADMGFTFVKDGSAFMDEGFMQLHLFDQGYGKKISNVISGNIEDVDVLLFDYQYTTGGGRNQSTTSQAVAAYRTSAKPITSFELRPEHIFHKIGQAFGYKDIDIQSYPEFSKRYLLRGEDEQAVRDCFTPAVLDVLDREHGWSIEADGQWMVVYRASKGVKVDLMSEFLDKTWNLFLLFEV